MDSINTQVVTKKEKEKSYVIKVPVFTTTMKDDIEGIFGKNTYSDMLNSLKIKIKDFKSEYSFENRNKTKRTVISKISFTDFTLGERPCILLQISAFNTNIYDGYFEADEKIQIQRNDKLGNENYFVLLYPMIKGLKSQNYTNYFLVLIYEDPTKESGETIKIAKHVVNKILNVPIQNIKLPTILEEIKQLSTIPELQIKYSALHNSDNDVDVKYREYSHTGKIKKLKEDHFKNMSPEKVSELLAEPDDPEYQRKETKLIVGKKEYKISRELINEADKELKETAEKIFNMQIGITQDELDNKVHEQDFVIEKLKVVLADYLSNEQE
jgi:hypothetical protein